MIFLVILLIVFLTFLAGAAGTAGSIFFALRRRSFLKKAAVTVGTVMKFSFHRRGTYTVGARFQTAAGQIVDCESFFRPLRRYAVGEPITVSYDPHDPQNVLLGDQNSIVPWIRYFMAGGVGAAVTLAGGLSLIFLLSLGPAPDRSHPYISPDKVNGSLPPGAARGNEQRQCSEKESLKFIRAPDAESVQLTVNNKSQSPVSVYLIGANNYQSKYETIAPNKSQTFRSPKRGEWWMITDAATGACRMIVSPPNSVDIE